METIKKQGDKMISSVDEYIKISEEFEDKYYFRGQANALWELYPYLFRNNNWIMNEPYMLNELSSRHPEEIKDKTGYFKLLVAQHYGLPTRLLDVTKHSLIALYFSVVDKSQMDKNGIVFIIDESKITHPEIDSKIIKNFAHALAITENETNYSYFIEKYNFDPSIRFPEVVLIESKYADYNSRAFLQYAHTILFGTKIIDNKISKQELITLPPECIKKKILISAESKNDILKELRSRYGIFEETVLMSIENTTKRIKDVNGQDIINPKYDITRNDKRCYDVHIYEKYSYKCIEKILTEVISKHPPYKGTIYRVYLNESELFNTALVCNVTYNEKDFKEKNPLNIIWHYNYDSDRILNVKNNLIVL